MMKRKDYVVYVNPELAPLIPSFLKIRQDDISTLEMALAQKDLATLFRIANMVHLSSRGYGFNELGELANRLEKLAKDGNCDSMQPIINEMRNCAFNSIVVYNAIAA